MTRKIPFAELSSQLERLDFELVTQPAHVLFEHHASKSLVMLRPYQAREIVSPTDLAVIRQTLDERGLMAAESLEDLMRKRAE